MKKYTKITDKNIGLIYHRLVSFFERNEFVSSQTDWGALPKLKNRLGLKLFKEIPNSKNTEKSSFSYLSLKQDEIDIILNQGNINSSISLIDNNYIGWIQVGDLIKIDSKQIKLKREQILIGNEGQKYLTTFRCATEQDYNSYKKDEIFFKQMIDDLNEESWNKQNKEFIDGFNKSLDEFESFQKED